MARGRRAAPRWQAAAAALPGQRWLRTAGKSAKCGKRRPYCMCPVTAPQRGAEWQMRDPITSHVTGKDKKPTSQPAGPTASEDRGTAAFTSATDGFGLLVLAPDASIGAPQSSPRGQSRPSASEAAAGPAPAPAPAPPSEPCISLGIPLWPLADSPPTVAAEDTRHSPSAPPSRGLWLRPATVPAPRSASASLGSPADCLPADGSMQMQRSSSLRGRARGGERTPVSHGGSAGARWDREGARQGPVLRERLGGQ